MKKNFIWTSLLISLNLHLIFFGTLMMDFSDVDLKLSATRAIHRVQEIFSNEKKTTIEKIEQVVDEMSLDLKSNLKELSKVKMKSLDKKKNIAEEGSGEKGEGKEKGNGRGYIKGFAGFLPPVEVSIIENPPVTPPDDLIPGPGEIVVMKVLPGKECDDKDSYGGVGIQFKFDAKLKEHVVDILAPGQPAERAGMKSGDIIKGDPLRFRGEKGTSVSIEYYRNGEKRVANLVREKICFKREKIKIPTTKQM